jgi:hypothetical protein
MVTSRIYVDPYGSQPHHSVSTKSIFKENNLRGCVIHSNYLDKLTNIYHNNTILNGLKIINIFRSNNNRTLNIQLSKGRIIQDNTLINILTPVNLKIEIFSEYNITGINLSKNYFEINNNHQNNFPINKTFGIFNSTVSSYNHLNWLVTNSQYYPQTNKTRIYTNQTITVSNTSGKIVNDNFPNQDNSQLGTIIIISKYNFVRFVHNLPIEFIPIYMTTDYKYYPTFNINTFNIIYSVITITKDLTNYIILPQCYKIQDELVSFYIKNKEYKIHNFTNLISYIDGNNFSL